MAEFDANAMNEAANDASLELAKIQEKYPEASEAIADWMKSNVPKAGWKRLGKVLTGRWS